MCSSKVILILTIIVSYQGITFTMDNHHKNQVTIQQTHGIITTERNRIGNYAMKDVFYNKSFVPAHERNSVSLKCDAIYSRSVHHPSRLDDYVKWFKVVNKTSLMRKELTNSSKHSLLISRQGSFILTELLIQSPEANDAGPYVCMFRTAIESITFEAEVEAHMSPVIDLIYTRRQSIRISEGKPVSIECKAQGYPLPQIRWMKDNETYQPEEIEPKSNPGSLAEEEKALTIVTEKIHFPSVNRSSHRAYIWCTASNAEGMDRVVVYLRVVDPLSPLWPGIGIILCIIILVVIIAVTEAKRKKEKKAIEDGDENIKMKEISRLQSTTEDPEIRQRFV